MGYPVGKGVFTFSPDHPYFLVSDYIANDNLVVLGKLKSKLSKIKYLKSLCHFTAFFIHWW